MVLTTEIHEKPSKTRSKTIFGSRKHSFSLFLLFFRVPHHREYYGESYCSEKPRILKFIQVPLFSCPFAIGLSAPPSLPVCMLNIQLRRGTSPKTYTTAIVVSTTMETPCLIWDVRALFRPGIKESARVLRGF